MVIRFTNKQKAEITDMVYRYRDELIHKGFDVKRITAVKFTERCYRRYGQCTSRSNENWAIITISSICLKGTKETLREVIMHELVHAMNGETPSSRTVLEFMNEFGIKMFGEVS